MDQQQQQQQQQQAHQQPAQATAMLAPQGSVQAHFMGLMTNPALAAAAAASPLFPPAAMLSNPGAFLTMPEVFAQGAAAPGGVVLPRLGTLEQQQQQQQQQQSEQQQRHAVGVAMANIGLVAMNGQQQQQQHVQNFPPVDPGDFDCDKKGRRTDLTGDDRAKQNRDRNREHARSTRLRKKAYVQKLKELVEGLHAERTEEVRQRRVAIQHLAEMQNVRRGVVRTFLRFHSNFESDPRKWETILEDTFWLKQPITPYRSFRRTEIEQVSETDTGPSGMAQAQVAHNSTVFLFPRAAFNRTVASLVGSRG